MPNKGRNNIKKTAINLNSKWLQNALKSMGVAAGETFKDIMPSTSTTVSSTAKIATETARSIRGNKVSSSKIANAITSNPIVKMGQDYFKNAIEDLKTGNLYNEDRAMSEFDDAFSDMDTFFDDIDDYFGDDESQEQDSQNVNINKNIINPPSNNGDATVKAIQQNGEYQLKSSKATVDTMVSVSSTLMVKMSELNSQIVSELSNVNTNLQSLIEYNNENITKFIEASIGYYEQATAAMGKEEESSSNSSSGVKPENFLTSKGLDLNEYKEFVKGNISKLKTDSTVGSMVSMILDNKEAFIGNPIGMVMKMGMTAAIPSIVKETMASVDKAVQNVIPVALSRISSFDKNESGVMGIIKQIIGKVFGVDIRKNEKFDTSKAIKKGPMPYNGVANHSIVEIIPRYLRESNNYLKEIAQAITGKTNGQLNEGVEGFDWFEGKVRNREDMKSDVYDQVLNDITSVFENSKFGKKLDEQSKYLSEDEAGSYNDVLSQFYLSLERLNEKIDFSEEQIQELLKPVNGPASSKNLIAETLSQMRENDANLLLDAEASKQKSTVRRNSTMKDIQSDAFERGLFQIDTDESIDDYALRKYGATTDGTVTTKSIQMSVPSLLQGIKSTLDRGIYVKVVKKFKGVAGEENANMDESATVNEQTKKDFTDSVNRDNTSGESHDRNYFMDQMNNNQEFTARQNAVNERLSSVFKSLLYGDSNAAFDDLVDASGNVFSKASEFLSVHFLNPIKKELFGEKDANGYIKDGLFAGVNNKLKESFFSFRRMITGKGYVDSNGATVPDANEDEKKNTVAGKLKSLVNYTKDSIKVKLFGEKDDEGNVVEGKEGVLSIFSKKMSSVSSSIAKGIKGWKNALFGISEDDDEDSETTIKETVKQLKEKVKEVIPDSVFGSTVGFGAGALAGGSILGTLVGGPIGGALIGFAGGIVSKSNKFQNWLFGEEDENGERTGGLISKQTQDYFKENGKFLAGGAALGAIKGTLFPGAGLLTSLVGGPVAGALMGIGTTMLVKSNMFQKFLFGDEENGQLGLVTNIKQWLGRFGKNSDGESEGSKLFGMTAIGTGAGGLLGMLMGGPVVGSLLGLSASIIAQKDNFREWFFGTEDENGNRKEGVLGKFKNMLVVDVFHPIRDTFKDIGDDFKTFLKYDILNAFNLVIEPLGDAFFAGVSKLTGKLVGSFSDFGNYIKENFLHGFIDKVGNILSPITNAANTVAKGVYNVSKQIIKAPLQVLSAITSPIAVAIGKTVGTVAKVAFKSVDLLLVKPIKTLVLKPLGLVVKGVGKIVSAPFKLLGNIAEGVGNKLTEGIEHIGRFAGRIKDGIVNAIMNSGPVKSVKKGIEHVKNFGARIKDTITEFVSPITDFVKSTISVIKDKITGAIRGFFKRVLGFFNPLNWFRKGKNLLSRLAGKEPSEEEPKKNGIFSRLGRIWRETGKGYTSRDHSDTIVKDENGNIIGSTVNNGKRRKYNKEARKAEMAKNKLTKEERKNIRKNEKTIKKWLGGNDYVDSERNRELAEYEAKKKGVVIDWGNVKAQQGKDSKVQDAMLEVQTQSKDYIKEIADFIMGRSRKKSNTMTRSKAKDMGREAGEKAATRDKAVRDAKKDAVTDEDGKRASIAKSVRKKARKKESKARQSDFNERYDTMSFSDAFKENLTQLKGFFEGAGRKRRDEKRELNEEKSLSKEQKRLEREARRRQKWAKRMGITLGDESDGVEIPKHAKGTNNADAGLAIVGENGPEAVYSDKGDNGKIVGMNGPEVVNLNAGDKVIPNNKINNISTQSSVSVEYSDKKLAQYSDTSKISLPFRILRVLNEIRDNLINGFENPFSFFNENNDENDEDSIDENTNSNENDTTNIDKIKEAFAGDKEKLLKMIPGYNLVKGAIGLGKTVVGAGKTLFGAGRELATIGIDKAGSAINKGISIGSNIASTAATGLNALGNFASSKFFNQEKEENDAKLAEIKDEKSKESQDEVSSLTGEKLRAEKEAEREEKSDGDREDAKLDALKNLNVGQKEHSKAWDFIFSKKGLITGALLAATPLLIKGINWLMNTDFGNVIGGAVGNFISGAFGTLPVVLEDLCTCMGVLTDGNSPITLAFEHIKNGIGIITDIVCGIGKFFGVDTSKYKTDSSTGTGNGSDGNGDASTDGGDNNTDASTDDRSIMDKFLYDEDGNVTNQTGANAKFAWNNVVAPTTAKTVGRVTTVADVVKNSDGVVDTVKNLASKDTRKAMGSKQARKNGANKVMEWGNNLRKKGMEGLADNVVDDVAEKGASVVKDAGKYAGGTAEEIAKAGDSKLMTKVIEVVKGFFDDIFKGASKKFPGIASKLSGTLLDDVVKCLTKHFSSIAKKIASIFAVAAGTAATVVGFLMKEGTMITLGAINGASGAARLFRTDNVDATMVAISALFGAFSGTTVGSVVDVVNELITSILGFDMYSELALVIYSGVKTVTGDTDAIDQLTADRAAFQEKYKEDTDAQINDQYESMKAAGLIDPEMSAEEFNEKARSGEIEGVKIDSFADYNDEQHKTLGAHLSDAGKGAWKAVKGAAGAVGGFFAGKDTSYEVDKNGNKYTQNDDGTWTMTDKDGNEIGTLGNDAVSQVDTETVTDHQKGVFEKIGDGLSGAWDSTKKAVSDKVNSVKDAVVAAPGNIAKGVSNFFTKDVTAGYLAKDGTYYTGDGKHYNMAGTPIGDDLTIEELREKLKDPEELVYSEDIVTRDSGLSKLSYKIKSTIKDVKDNITKGFTETVDKLKKAGSWALNKSKELGTAFLTYEKNRFVDHTENVYYSTDGTYYDSNGKHYNASGYEMGDDIEKEELEGMIQSGVLVPGDATIKSGIKQDIHNTIKIFNSAKTAVVEGFKNAAEGLKKAGTWALDKGKKLGKFTLTKMIDLKNFYLPHKETRWRATDGGYYQSNGSSYDYYNMNGDKVAEGIPADQFNELIEEGLVIEDSSEQVTVGPEIINRFKDLGSSIKENFTRSLDTLKEFVGSLKSTGSEAMSYIKEHGLGDYVKSLFKRKVATRYGNPSDGHYYLTNSDGKTCTYYNANGDVLGENVPLDKVLEMVDSGILTDVSDVEIDTGAKATFKDVAGAVKKAVSKAGEIAKNSWDSFTKFLGISTSSTTSTGGSGSGIATLLNNEYPDTVQTNGGSGIGPSRRLSVGGGRGDEPSTLNGSVYYSQNDPAWKNDKFIKSDGTDDGATMGNSGCGPTAMSMVVSSMQNKNVSPLEMAKVAQLSGTRDDTGTNWNFVDTAANTYGIDSTSSYNPSSKFIEANLKNGNPMILSGTDDGSGKSPYTTAGHYIVATGIDSSGNISINDPRGVSYSGKKRLSDFIGNTGAAWSFSNTGARGGRGAFLRHIIGGGRNIDVNKWISIVKAVKAAIAAKKLGYSQTNFTDITLDNKTIKVRTDCSGLVSACLTFYGVMNEGTYVSSSSLIDMNNSTMKNTGFSPRKFTSWDDCQVGDIVARSGHTEIFAGMSNGKPTVWNCGSDSSCNSADPCGVAYPAYTTVWSPGDAGSGAVNGTVSTDASSSSSSTESSFISKVSSAFSSVLNAGMNAALTGNYNEDWDSILNGGSQQSSDSSNSGVATTGTVDVADGDTPKAVWNYLKTNGFSDDAAAGILGNMQQESGVDPTKIQGNGKGPAAGIVQWENYTTKSSRWKSMSDYAKTKGKDWTDLQSQLEFMIQELNNLDIYFNKSKDVEGHSVGATTFSQFKSSTDVDDATYQFEKAFERAGKPNMSNRISAARTFKTKYANGGSGDGVSISKKRYIGSENIGANGEGNSVNQSEIIKHISLIKDIGIKDNTLTNPNTTNNSDINVLMEKVISLLSDISNKSNNLTYLKDIDKIQSNNIITNTTVQAPSKTGTSAVVPTGNNKISVDEVTARKIAFGY